VRTPCALPAAILIALGAISATRAELLGLRLVEYPGDGSGELELDDGTLTEGRGHKRGVPCQPEQEVHARGAAPSTNSRFRCAHFSVPKRLAAERLLLRFVTAACAWLWARGHAAHSCAWSSRPSRVSESAWFSVMSTRWPAHSGMYGVRHGKEAGHEVRPSALLALAEEAAARVLGPGQVQWDKRFAPAFGCSVAVNYGSGSNFEI
jgi:hypothetical protein